MINMKVVKQHDLRDCGVACLLSIIRYYRGNVPIEQLRLDTKTTKDGTTAYNLVYCAKKYGLDAVGYKATIDFLKSERIVFPCIAHINKNGLDHFIVIYQLQNNKLLVMDPAIGKNLLNYDEFLKLWTGYLIMFYPKSKLPFIKTNNSLILYFINFLKQNIKLFILIFIANMFFILFTLFSSYYFKIGIEHSINHFKIIIITFSIITVLKCLYNYIRDYFENYLNKNLDIYMIYSFLNHLFHLPSYVIVNRTVGEIITRVNELNNIKGLFSELFVSFFLNFLLSIVTMLILFKFNSTLFLILCLCIIFYLGLGIVSSKTIYKKASQNIELEDRFNTVLVENIDCFQSIKNLNVTEEILCKIEQESSHYVYDKFKLSKYITKIDNIKFSLGEICIFTINSFGFHFILQGKMQLSNLILFNSLMVFFLDPLKNLINSMPKYYFLKASFVKLNEFLNIKEENSKRDENELNDYSIELKNISFSYNDFKYILNGFNAIINKNEHVMLWGPSGCGKSTICKIISKNELPKSGFYFFGGINANTIDAISIKKIVTYVSQHERLYSDTIKNNLIFYRDINQDVFNKIMVACRVDEFVNKRPLSYESMLNTESNNLSGGEKQRLILARACLNNFKVLIIDEALSEVDYDLEAEIIKNLRQIFCDKTIIYISHKNHTKLFDRVINMEDNEKVYKV